MSSYSNYARYVQRTYGRFALAFASVKFVGSRIEDVVFFVGSAIKTKNPKDLRMAQMEALPIVGIPTTDFWSDIIFEKTAVIIHIFYPELTAEIMEYVKNIPIKYGLFISTDSDEKAAVIKEAIALSGVEACELEVKVTPNRGRDIAPTFIGFRDVFSRYPCFIHLHSKRSLSFKGQGDSWRHHLLCNLLGSRDIAESCLRLLSFQKTGIVYADHFGPAKKNIGWSENFDLTRAMLKYAGVKISKKTIPEFPSGSMFWGRSDAVKKILDLHLTYDDFPEEKGQIDGTLAHAIEHAFLLFAEGAGFSWVKTKLKTNSEKPKPWYFTPLLPSKGGSKN